MKRRRLLILLLCLVLAGCWDAVPAPTSAAVELPQPIAPAAQAILTEPTEASPEPSPEVAQWLPPFAPRKQWEGVAVYEKVTKDEAAVYTAKLEAAGFQSYGKTVFYTDRLILVLQSTQESGCYTLEWFEAELSAPVPDLAAIQAKLPDDYLICLVDRTPDGMYEATGLRRMLCVTADTPAESTQPAEPGGVSCHSGEYLLGKSGFVPMQGYYASHPCDPLWADLDGDGTAEYVYWTAGPTSGVFTVALWAYGTEHGIPVVKGHSIWSMYGTVGLEKDGAGLYLRYGELRYDRKSGEDVPQPEQLISLALENGMVMPKDGALPEEVAFWGGFLFDTCMGQSFQALRERMGGFLVYESPHCIVWTDAVTASSPESITTYAAMTNNGVSVTGYLSFSADHSGICAGVTPIQTPDDLEALTTLDWPELEERFGPCHFDNGSGVYIAGWFTEDGKLLSMNGVGGTWWSVCLFDPVTGDILDRVQSWEVVENQPSEPDVVTVTTGIVEKSEIKNESRWQTFLTAAEQGQPDAIAIHILFYGSGVNSERSFQLRFDGERYWLGDGEEAVAYRYLLVSVDDDLTTEEGFNLRRSIHYFLSDDPEMTYDRYFSHTFSSLDEPDFPPTVEMFSLRLDN
ncbi:MAG: hypothetical protein J5789_03950 [Oscillospiraceae bacterium]|nr:hypothetical protein [Oscillospiraceae bacterium]